MQPRHDYSLLLLPVRLPTAAPRRPVANLLSVYLIMAVRLFERNRGMEARERRDWGKTGPRYFQNGVLRARAGLELQPVADAAHIGDTGPIFTQGLAQVLDGCLEPLGIAGEGISPYMLLDFGVAGGFPFMLQQV